MDIPLPEEDDLSDDDDFDGYIDGEIEDEDGNRDDGNGNDSDGNDSDGHDSESGGNGQNGGDEQDSDNGGVEIPEYLGHPRLHTRHGKQKSNRLLSTDCH